MSIGISNYRPYLLRFGLIASQLILFYVIRDKNYSSIFLTIFSLNGLLGVILSNSSAESLDKSNSKDINIHISFLEIITGLSLAVYNTINFGIVGITSIFILYVAPVETYLKGYNKQHWVYSIYILINLMCLVFTKNEYVLLCFFGLKLISMLLLSTRFTATYSITRAYEIQKFYINRQNIINHLIGLELSYIPEGLLYKIYSSVGNTISVFLNVRNFQNYSLNKNFKTNTIIKVFLNSFSVVLILLSSHFPILYPAIVVIQAYISYISWDYSWDRSIKFRNILLLSFTVIFILFNQNIVLAVLLAELTYDLWKIKK
jgi:hypothetical protein